MTQAALALVQDKCEKCSRSIEPDGFCSWHGQFADMWVCDDCVSQMQGGGSSGALQRPVPTLEQIELALVVVDGAIKNLGMIDLITGRDGAMACRDVSLYLNFKESKQVYRLLADILRSKLDAAKDVAAQNARDLLERLNRRTQDVLIK
jgi:hypothetical protein